MSEPSGAAGRQLVVERLADEFVRSGMPRMPSRVFAALLATDAGRLTAADLADGLRASAGAISGAVRYLEHQGMVRRTREPGDRRDVFALGDDVWYETLAHRDGLIRAWEDTMAAGAAALGPDTAAGRRMSEMRAFFAFLGQEMPQMLERWRLQRERGRHDVEDGGHPS